MPKRKSKDSAQSSSRTVVRKINLAPSMDEAAFTAGPNLLLQEGASSMETPTTSAAETLQVPTNEEKIAYYESLLLPADFYTPPYIPPSPFSPPPIDNMALAFLFDEDEHGGYHIDYAAAAELFYPLVHPNCDEFTIDPATGLRTVRNSFVNIAIVPDFFINNDAVRRILDLCP
jgi:hypothetical protein